MKTIFYKRKVKKLLGELEKDMESLLIDYNKIKFSSHSEKASVWFDIKTHEFAIEQLKSII